MCKFILRHKVFFIIVLSLILVKVLWVMWSCWGNGSFDKEKTELLQRRNYLIKKIMVEPVQLISEMPSEIGLQFQGEWALYSCSMLCEAMANLAEIYPDTRHEAVPVIDSLIQIAMTREIRLYDMMRWREDPLESLKGTNSHVSYLSHLAWMIGNYRRVGGDTKYDCMHDLLCEAMNRRMARAPMINLPTYPDEPIYVPDMLVAVVALSDYSKLNGGIYGSTVQNWLNKAKTEWLDAETGLLVSFLDETGMQIDASIKGSYSALNCYYLSLLDLDFAHEQYYRLKKFFMQGLPVPGLKEYHDHLCLFGVDMDAGLILFNLSPSGTAFAIGCATCFGDNDFRNRLLQTAEIVGHTVKSGNCRHYLLSDLALVGEAITLAMRTNRGR